MKGKQGFTLVELIVVIAIIAILAVVSIVGFTGFIERARLSNDRQLAAQMTDLIGYHYSENSGLIDEPIDADGVRSIVNEGPDNDFDFIPETSNAGFFYIEEQRTIIVAKYEDISDPDFKLSESSIELLGSKALLNQSGDEIGSTPEEIFGAGKHLLTTEGNVVAEVVTKLRELATLPKTSITQAYQDILDTIENDGFFAQLFDNGVPREKLEALANRYDPTETIFVNNYSWEYEERPLHFGWTAKRILFAPGIVNIPKYDGPRTTVLETVAIPSTVRTIEADAFSNFVERTLSFEIKGNATIYAESGAFPSSMDPSKTEGFITDHPFPEEPVTLEVTKHGETTSYPYPDMENIPNLLNASAISINITGLPRESIDDLNINLQDGTYEVRIYSDEGLIGITRIPVTYGVEFKLNESGTENIEWRYEGSSDWNVLSQQPDSQISTLEDIRINTGYIQIDTETGWENHMRLSDLDIPGN